MDRRHWCPSGHGGASGLCTDVLRMQIELSSGEHVQAWEVKGESQEDPHFSGSGRGSCLL